MTRLLIAILTAWFIVQHSQYPSPIAVVFAAGPTTKTTTYNYLFNLDDDPNEDVNLWDEVEYVNLKKNFEERLTYWIDYLIDPQVPDTTNAPTAYAAAGGYAPWLETPTTINPLTTIDIKYDVINAPHIVFVLVDDWGWNDAGWRSTYMSWTTPNIDRLAKESVLLDNHYSHEICTPTRGALMTGRFALRLGQWDVNLGELPLTETTIAQEMKSAGYRTYLIGKWDLGYSTRGHLPTSRGYDYFYGYLNGVIDYWDKTFEDILDLHENDNIVTTASETSSSLHAAHLFQQKVETVIQTHSTTYPTTPMFLMYPTQLIHSPWDAPESYIDRCALYSGNAGDASASGSGSLQQNYCALNLMFDEVIANLTCALAVHGMSENTILVIASDNGGEKHMAGNTYPFKGHKGYYFRGGVSSQAIVHSPLLPVAIRGTTFHGHMHVTDWLPTLMSAATGKQWKGSYTGATIDGRDFWPAITGVGPTPDKEIVFYVSTSQGVIQSGGFKYFYGQEEQVVEIPTVYFEGDQHPSYAHQHCNNPNLLGMDVNLIVDTNVKPSFSPIVSASSSSTPSISTTGGGSITSPSGSNNNGNNGTNNGILPVPPGKEGIPPASSSSSSSSSSHSNVPLLISGVILLVGLLLLGYRSHPGYATREKEGEVVFENMSYSIPGNSYTNGTGRVDSYQTLDNVDREEIDVSGGYHIVDEELAVRKYRFNDDDDDATDVLIGKTGGSGSISGNISGAGKKYVFPGDDEDDDEEETPKYDFR